MTDTAEFWAALAPHHHLIEDNYLDLATLRGLRDEILDPVLVVGAGQGLIVDGLRRQGFRAQGVDVSPEMIDRARAQRQLVLVRADARDLPFPRAAFKTVICATGVLDFIAADDAIRLVLREARRVAGDSGHVLAAFYRMSPAGERLMRRMGLLRDGVLRYRDTMAMYDANPWRVLRWVAQGSGLGLGASSVLLMRTWLGSSAKEKRFGFDMLRLLGRVERRDAFLGAVPDRIPYRNAEDVRALFERLQVPIRRIQVFGGCSVAAA